MVRNDVAREYVPVLGSNRPDRGHEDTSAVAPTCDRRLVGLIALTLALGELACTEEAFLNLTRPLGDGAVGQRNNITISFINNTPFRVICTFGLYDPADQETVPNFSQFYASDDTNERLEGNSIAGPFTIAVGRAVSVGGARLIELILENDLDEGRNADALRPGVGFSGAAFDSELANLPTEGTAEEITLLHGVDYPFDALIIFTFEQDESKPGGFRIDFDVVLP